MPKMKKNELLIGESLKKGEYIQNDDGAKLMFENNGNLVLYDNPIYGSEEATLWDSGTDDRGEILKFNSNGNLAIYNANNEIIWESNTGNSGANCLSINGFTPVLITKSEEIEQSNIYAPKEHYRFRANRNIFEHEISVGVVLVGSLLWQNDGKIEGDNQRKNWRDKNFITKNNEIVKIPIKFPIRYGRMSQGDVYTMVVSSETTANNNLGTAMLVKAKNKLKSKQEVLEFAKELAEAEGIKSKDVIKATWAFIAYGLNPKVKGNNTITKSINAFWELKASDREYYKIFKMNSENESVLNHKGELEFISKNWLTSTVENLQNEIDNIDLILVTVTKPCLSTKKIPDQTKKTGYRIENDESRYPTIEELASSVVKDTKRFYFYNNCIAGIKTFEDESIIYNSSAPESSKSTFTQASSDVFYNFEIKRLESKRFGNLLLHLTGSGQIITFHLTEKQIAWKAYNSSAHVLRYDAKIGDLRAFWLSSDKTELLVWQIEAFRYSLVNQMTYQVNTIQVNNNQLQFSITERWGWINRGGDGYRDLLPNLIWRTSSKIYEIECNETFCLYKNENIKFNEGTLTFTEEGVAEFNLNNGMLYWSSPANKKGQRLDYQEDGNLVIYNNREQKDPVWSADIFSHKGVSKYDIVSFKKRLVIQNDRIQLEITDRKTKSGVLENLYWQRVIQTYENNIKDPFVLKKGEAIKINTSSRNYYIYFNVHGILELLNEQWNHLWSSPSDKNGTTLEYQKDGNLVIYKGDSSVWAISIYKHLGVDDPEKNIVFADNLIEIKNNTIEISITNRRIEISNWDSDKRIKTLSSLYWSSK